MSTCSLYTPIGYISCKHLSIARYRFLRMCLHLVYAVVSMLYRYYTVRLHICLSVLSIYANPDEGYTSFWDDLNMRHIQIDGGSVTAFRMICHVTFSGKCRVVTCTHTPLTSHHMNFNGIATRLNVFTSIPFRDIIEEARILMHETNVCVVKSKYTIGINIYRCVHEFK